MAGSAATSALMQVVFEKLLSSLVEELVPVLGVRKDVGKLSSTMRAIRAVLEDAEDPSRPMNNALLDWLTKLKDAAYEAEYVLDDFQTEALRRRAATRFPITSKVRSFFSPSNPIVFRFIMAHRIKDVMERFNELDRERNRFHLKEVPVLARSPIPTDSSVDESEIFGRQEDKEKVVRMLVGTDSERDLAVLPIVGMGGLGKTTLAQLVYNDETVKKHFELRIWVCVSEDFDLKRLTRAIIECVSKECLPSEMEPLRLRLQEVLNGRRFLLVLDDVWNEDEDEDRWDRLKRLLRCGMRGSKVVVTTRNHRVALVASTIPPYNLNILSEDDCWTLFKRKAFRRLRQGEEDQMLIAIGKDIVKKCEACP